MTAFTPHQDTALKAVADWLRAKPGERGTPQVFRLFGFAGTGKTTLARHIADGVDGEVKYAAFTGKAALVMRNKGCDERLHHPLADLSRPRDARRAADLRAVGRRAGLEGEADRHRRMLDGRCRARPRPVVVRLPAAGARRPGAAAADPGRRLLHQRRARRDADRGAPPGAGRPDRAAVDGRARGPRHRGRQLRRNRGRPPQRARSGTRDAGRSGAGRPQQHAQAPTTCASARSSTSPIPCPSPATSWCACATTARRRCSTAGCGG